MELRQTPAAAPATSSPSRYQAGRRSPQPQWCRRTSNRMGQGDLTSSGMARGDLSQRLSAAGRKVIAPKSRASRTAVALPIPELAPVTMATAVDMLFSLYCFLSVSGGHLLPGGQLPAGE